MGIGQGIWILYSALLTLNLLSVNEHKMTVAERYWILGKKTTRLNQSMYFKNMLTLERKSENVLQCGRHYTFFSHSKQNAMDSFTITKDQI